jgi:hypothetical protein
MTTMNKKELAKIIDDVLKPHGFKKKGNYWRLECDELIKIVNLQKSQWGDQYYINYGFDIKGLENDELIMHIYRRIGSKDTEGNNILDLENKLPGDRVKMIVDLLNHSLLTIFAGINSRADLLTDLRQQPHLNDVPLKVKAFLGLQ